MPTQAEQSILDNGKEFSDYPRWGAIKNDPFLSVYTAIAKFLGHEKDEVFDCLRLLERELADSLDQGFRQNDSITYFENRTEQYRKARKDAQFFTKKGIPNSVNNMMVDGQKTLDQNKNTQFSKLLTNILAKNEKDLKFAVDTPTLLKFLSAAHFREIMSQGIQFKDPGALLKHGDLTHRIQWYLIGKSKINADAKVYQEIATYAEGRDIKMWDGKDTKLLEQDYMFTGLWDALFDRLEAEGNDKSFVKKNKWDFRCPEILNMYLVENATATKNYPILTSILRMRYEKKAFIEVNTPDAPTVNSALGPFDGPGLQYLAFKLYRVPFARLGELQKGRLIATFLANKGAMAQWDKKRQPFDRDAENPTLPSALNETGRYFK